jgi:hypothetical protein
MEEKVHGVKPTPLQDKMSEITVAAAQKKAKEAKNKAAIAAENAVMANRCVWLFPGSVTAEVEAKGVAVAAAEAEAARVIAEASRVIAEKAAAKA